VSEADEHPDQLIDVITALCNGRAVVLPTDTVYGLCALPFDRAAMAEIFDRKGRSADTPIAVLCADSTQALALADLEAADRASVERVAAALWPGPLTLVLPRRADLGWPLGEPVTTIGLRVPDDPFLRELMLEVGPLAATSANRHGEPTAPTAAGVAASLGADLPLVDGGDRGTVASTVVDAIGHEWRVLREGNVSRDRLRAVGAPIPAQPAPDQG